MQNMNVDCRTKHPAFWPSQTQSLPTLFGADDDFCQTQTPHKEQEGYRKQNGEIKCSQTTSEIKEDVKASKVEDQGNGEGC